MTTQNRIKTVLTLAVVVVSIGAMAGSASASVLVYEPFAYADGWLTGQGGALGTTGTWTADDYYSGDWRIHQEGETSGVVVDPGPPVVRNMFDGTVDNLLTSGGYVGLPGPTDTGADPDLDHEIGRYLDASIALDPTVTATFQSGTTTWFSYVTAKGWDRNEETANLTIGLKEWRATAAVCQDNGKKWILDVCARLFGGFRHNMLEFSRQIWYSIRKEAQRRS